MTDAQGTKNSPLAIVGMACRLPAAANLAEYWQLLIEGRSAVRELPPERLDQKLYFDPEVGVRGKSYSKLGAILASRQFDPKACPIAPQLVESVDNAHLLMCQTAAAALRHGGMDPLNLPIRNVGVYIGHAQGSNLGGDYTCSTYIADAAEFLEEIDEFRDLPAEVRQAIARGLIDQIRATRPGRDSRPRDVGASMVAGTIAKAFELSGPFLAIDSACASSLQAMWLGARALQLGHIDMAIVGGASDCKADSLVLFSAARALSANGSRPFDAEADGLVCGEGYVALILKTLARAVADGDPIHAVVRGLGVSSDGKGKSLWAPRKEGQTAAMQRAYPDNVPMATLQYIEAHATATQVGDATELQTLSEILKPHLPSGHKIAIGSVKANIGHSLEAAGVAGVIKTVLAMQHRTIPPAINLRQPNSKVAWDSLPIYVPTAPTPWPVPMAGQPRRAGVNAFGIGGLNMHVLLEEFDGVAPSPQSTQPAHDRVPAAIHREDEGHPIVTHSTDDDAVAVIGMGCLFPGALNVPEYWDLLVSGRDARQVVPADRWRLAEVESAVGRGMYRRDATLGGFITGFRYDWRRHKVPPKQVDQADPLQFMLLEATDQAMRDAGYDTKPFDRTRVGVVVGTEFGGDFAFQLQMGLRLPEIQQILRGLLESRSIVPAKVTRILDGFASTLLKHWPALIDETGSFTASSLASRLAKTWNLMGGAAAVDSGGASALAALLVAANAIRAGDCDMMICATGQRRMGLPEYESLAVAGVLANHMPGKNPLDADYDGVVPGEGVGVVVLKRLAHARQDGDRIHAIVRGIGAAHHPSRGEALRMAIQQSFQLAGAQPADVALLELGGVGPRSSNQDELEVVSAIYGQTPRQRPLLVSAVAGQIGYTEAASGMAAFIKATLEIDQGRVPHTVGLQQPAAVLADKPMVVQAAVNNTPVVLTTRDGRRLAAITSSARGLTYHAIIEHGTRGAVATEPVEPRMLGVGAEAEADAAHVTVGTGAVDAVAGTAANSGRSWRICRIGAARQELLTDAIGSAITQAQHLFESAPGSQFGPADRCRVAVVVDSPETLQQKLTLAQNQLANPAARGVLERQGIFYRQVGDVRPRVAFVFPGQGSQYLGMLRSLVQQLPAAADAWRDAEALMARYGQSFSELAWSDRSALGTDVFATQAAMLAADHVVHVALTSLGIRADLMLGHSYGEYAALTAAGAWELATALQVTRARCDAIEASPSCRGGMLATNAPPDLIAELSGGGALAVYIANYNAPNQIVVGGARQPLMQLSALLQDRKFQARMLAVPCPFHTPLMQPAAARFEQTLHAADIRQPRVATYSVVTNRPVSGPDEMRANLVAHLTTPVRYATLISDIAALSPTAFVEVGPQQALSGLHRHILPDHSVGIVACDNPQRPGLEPLLHVQALLACAGVLESPPHPAVSHTVSRPTTQNLPTLEEKKAMVHFDATARRRQKMRDAATSLASQPAPPPTLFPVRHAPPETPTLLDPPERRATTDSARKREELSHYSPAPPPPPSVVPNAAAEHRPPNEPGPHKQTHPGQAMRDGAADDARADTTALGRQLTERERFLINFVVEQTGYPPEVVELDADLEADLGIDSIKKAQLFGELQDYFDVTVSEELTLDDFPTLRHVVNFLATVPAKQPLETAMGEASWAEPASQAQAPAQVFANPLDTAAAADAYSSQAAKVAAEPMPTTAASSGTTSSTRELEQFLVNFVVEQTGYPPEVVELDADLEADLGIDSIKKAQLFGELQDYFDVTVNEELTLDDFPTLRHVVSFLAATTTKQPLVTATDEAQGSAVELASPTGVSITTAGGFEVEREMPAIAAANVAAEPLRTTVTSADTTSSTDELERFLVNFVVEQTGYPPEVVELDADLEADLGIDSIKKAQLFGELQDYFDVTVSEELTLDDFPTLRHVVSFLAGAATQRSLVTATDDSAAINGAAGTWTAESPTAAISTGNCSAKAISSHTAASDAEAAKAGAGYDVGTAVVRESGLQTIELSGSPYEIGYQHGRLMKGSIRRALRRMADVSGGRLDELPLPQIALKQPDRLFRAQELDELRGIAAAAAVPLGNIVAYNLAVFSEMGAGTIHFAITAGHNGQDGMLHCVREELPVTSVLSDCLIPIVQVRRPATGIAHATFSFAGLVGGLGGVNARGLSITAGLLLDRRPASCQLHPLLVHAVLGGAADINAAVDVLRRVQGSGAWNACISHGPSDQVCYVEYDGRTLETRLATDAVMATPRCQLHANASVETPAAHDSRLGLEATLAAALPRGGLSASEACAVLGKGRLAVPEGTMSTQATAHEAENGERPISVVIDSTGGQLWFNLDTESDGNANGFVRLAVRDVLPAADWSASNVATSTQQEEARPSRSGYDLDSVLAGPRVAQRYEMRMLEVPFPSQAPATPTWCGAALVLGDGVVSDVLRRRLAESGADVVQLPVSEDIDRARDDFQQLWQAKPITHLFIVTGRDGRSLGGIHDQSNWQHVYRREVLVPYFLCQRWVQLAGEARLLDRCTIASVVGLGGDFGFSGQVNAPQCGALTGLMKAVHVETVVIHGHRSMVVKAIDAPANEPPESLVTNIFRELAAGTDDYEAAFVQGRRYLQNAHQRDAEAGEFADIRPGETWIVTGGARGISAACAGELGHRFGVNLHLIGRSPYPQIDPDWKDMPAEQQKSLRLETMRQARATGQDADAAWQAVLNAIEMDRWFDTFQAAGLNVTYHRCDVADATALEDVLDRIRKDAGPIDGILHGAGVDRSCRFEKKQREPVLATLGSKVQGAYNLMVLTHDDPVRHFIGFGSISGRLGSDGQADYCAASDMLCKLISWYGGQRPTCRAIALHFHPWDEVGMAATPEAKAIMQAAGGPTLMPKDEGIWHLLRELYSRSPAAEVLITSDEYHRRFYGQDEGTSVPRPMSDRAPELEPALNSHRSPAGKATVDVASAAATITERLVVRMIDEPLPELSIGRWLQGGVVIVGDNPPARALRQQLQGRGANVVLVPATDDIDQAKSSLDRAWQKTPVAHLFILTPHDTDSRIVGGASDVLTRRRTRGVLLPFELCQHWLQRLAGPDATGDGATLYVCTALGGDFGLSGNVGSVESGALTGLIKGLYLEAGEQPWKGVRFKAVDCASDESPEVIAAEICLECDADTPDLEVGYLGGRRRVVRAVAKPLADEECAQHEIRAGGTWVVTGGARGVTAAAALALATRFGLRLHLLGTTPAPRIDESWRTLTQDGLSQLKATVMRQARDAGQSPAAAWGQQEKALEIDRTLCRFRQAGIQATYHCCDVADGTQLAGVLEHIRQLDGPIEGVLHGAGVAVDAWFTRKKREHVLRTIATKVDGAAALMQLTANDPLRYFVGFGSLSGRFGAKGQSDYCAANDMLCKLIDWFRMQRPECAAVGIHWHAWDEVGMAMKPELKAMFESIKLTLMPTAEGIGHLTAELLALAPEPEVIFTEQEHYRKSYPLNVLASTEDVQETPCKPRVTQALERVAAITPLIDQLLEHDEGRRLVAEARLDPSADPFLIEHRMGGKPILPAVIAMELMAEAGSLLARESGQVVGLRSLNILTGLVCASDAPRTVRVTAEATGAGISCCLISDHYDRRGRLVEANRTLATGTVEIASVTSSESVPYAGQPPLGWYPLEYPSAFTVQHGPKFRCLKNLFCQYDGGFGRIIAPPIAELAGGRSDRGWFLPPAVLDGCLVACSTYTFVMFQRRVEIPLGLQHLRLVRLPRPAEECSVRMYFRGQDTSETRYDFVLFGDDQGVILSAEGYRSAAVSKSQK